MKLAEHVAKHLKGVYFGGNWTDRNLKDSLTDVTWQMATTQVYDLNTIATLTYHMSYYVTEVIKVLKGGPLVASDKYSFSHPEISSQEDWDNMLSQIWTDAEEFSRLIAQMPDSKFGEVMADEKYGNYYVNLAGIIEHCHYHLGQIALIKKILLHSDSK